MTPEEILENKDIEKKSEFMCVPPTQSHCELIPLDLVLPREDVGKKEGEDTTKKEEENNVGSHTVQFNI